MLLGSLSYVPRTGDPCYGSGSSLSSLWSGGRDRGRDSGSGSDSGSACDSGSSSSTGSRMAQKQH